MSSQKLPTLLAKHLKQDDMMHICHITSMHQWNDDRIFERACKMLVKLGHKVTLIATTEKDFEDSGVRILAVKPRSGWKRRLFSSQEAYKIALELDADIFHFHDPDLMPWMNQLARKGKNVVMDVHENYQARFFMWGLPGPVATIGSSIYRLFELHSAGCYAGLVPVSESVLNLFAGTCSESAIVQNVPDPERFPGMKVNWDRPLPRVVYTSGTNSSARNCMQTVEAMPQVLKAHPDVIFQFVGRYEPENYKEVLLLRAKELGVEANLRLEGMMPWADNFRRTERTHIGCVFYEDNPNNRVTIPNRLFEYMFCGVSVLAHDFPELRKVVSECGCGRIVDSAHPEAVARVLIEMLNDDSQRIQQGQNGHRAVMERYNYRTQCESMVEMYKRIMATAR